MTIERQFARIRHETDYWAVVWHHRPNDMHIVLFGLLVEALV